MQTCTPTSLGPLLGTFAKPKATLIHLISVQPPVSSRRSPTGFFLNVLIGISSKICRDAKNLVKIR